MARIKLNDLPQNAQISPAEMKKVFGGAGITANSKVSNISLAQSLSVSVGVDRTCVDCASGACNYCSTCLPNDKSSMLSNSALTNNAIPEMSANLSAGMNVKK